MNEEQAKRRFLAIQLVRLIGIVMAVFGVVTMAGKTGLPVEAGYVLFAVGFADAILAPMLLAKRWKSRDE